MDVSMNPEPTPKLNPKTLTSLRVRCPDCRKLYLVRLQDIREIKPRFECAQCALHFWIPLDRLELDAEVTGTPMHTRAIPAPAPRAPLTRPSSVPLTTKCPKCGKITSTVDGDCEHCGVVLEKYRLVQSTPEGVPPHSLSLAAFWQTVVGDYADEKLHDEFVRRCQREGNLALASAHYAAMRTLMPTDELTARRLREVQALGLTLLAAEINHRPRTGPTYPRLWQIPLLGATLVLIVGLVLPVFRNIAAVGAGLVFLAVMLRFHRR